MFKGIIAAVSAAGISLSIAQAMATTAPAPTEPIGESDEAFGAADRESFRQDIEHLQQNFYQASPESRRRWIESVRERRQLLDREEDRAPPPQVRIKPTRAANGDATRPSGPRPPQRDRGSD